MINCKYDLLTCDHNDGEFVVYKPNAMHDTKAFQVRSTKLDAKPGSADGSSTLLHTSLSLIKYSDDKSLPSFSINAPYDTLNIPQSIDSTSVSASKAPFKLKQDVIYDSSVSAEENVKRVIKMYSDELKQWMFNFRSSVSNGYYNFNTYYVKNCVGGYYFGADNPLNSFWAYYKPRYTASNAHLLRRTGSAYGSVQCFIPAYSYNNLHLKTPDTIQLAGQLLNTEYTHSLNLTAGMISPKMQYPDDSRGYDTNFQMPHPVMFSVLGDQIIMNYCDYTSTNYISDEINNTSVLLNPVTWEHTMMWTPGCMFWNKGGVNISYDTTTTPARLSIAYCKYSEESSKLTNAVTIAAGSTEINVNISAVRPDLVMDSNHYASLVPIYHFEVENENKNYFVVALFHNERTYSAMYPNSYKGLFILCMETGEMYNAESGVNHKRFALSSDFDVSNLLFIYGWQQYEDAVELGSNAFQYTGNVELPNDTTYTFNNKRIEICPYKAFGNFYIVNNPSRFGSSTLPVFDKWFVYDLDKHEVHKVTNVSVSYNHCVSTDGMYGFRFVSNNKTQYVINNNYTYPTNPTYNENIIDCIGIVRPIPLNLTYTNMQSGVNHYFRMHSFTYKPKEVFEPLDLNKSIAAFTINSQLELLNSPLPLSTTALYFVVDITTDDGFLEFHHKRIKPEHLQLASLQPIDIPYTLSHKQASNNNITAYNNIKVYISEFTNNDSYVCNGNEQQDVDLKQSAITITNQSLRIRLYDENNNTITQDQLRQRYGVASIDLDFLF